MISQLCGGTALNPTLSVTAPPGLQFSNANPKPVPIVYGNAFVEGTMISDTYAEAIPIIPGNPDQTTDGAAMWEAICCGKIKLNWMLVDSKIFGMSNFNPYDPTRFNDGTGSFFPPTLQDRNQLGIIPLPYLSPLHGIAHYEFLLEDGLPVSLSANVPKVKFDVTRILNTGLSINGDDIPVPADDANSVSAFTSLTCMFINHTNQIGVFGNYRLFKPNAPIVFLPPPSNVTLPFTPGTVYYIKTNNGQGPTFIVTISATPGGPALPVGNSNIYGIIALVTPRNAGNNPASVIWDLLTNSFYGLGLSSVLDNSNPDINVASFQQVLNFFFNTATYGKPYGVNCSFQDKIAAKDMIKKICEWTDCILTLDNDGRFFLTVNEADRVNTSGRIGGATGLPATLSTDDFVSFTPNIKTFDDTINEFRGKFISFADNYAALEVFFRNEANINATGTVRSKEYDISGMIFPDIIATRLFEIAKRESFPLITLQTVAKIGMLIALVNDIFRVTFPEYGIDDYFKITKIVLDALETSQVKVEWSQCPELMFDLNSTSLSQASPTVPSTNIPGGNLVVENLTFPAGTNLSTARSVAYTTDADSTVVWGVGQEDTGTLTYDPDSGFANNGDYTIVGHTQVKLNPVKFANEIQANVLGLLNVDTY